MLNSISQITGGTTINCENVANDNGPAGAVLGPYNISASDIGIPGRQAGYTNLVTWVTGNADAPYAAHVLLGQLKLTPSVPWASVGVSGASNFVGDAGDAQLTLKAFGQSGQLIGSVTRLFDSSSDHAQFNANVPFLGVASETDRIYWIELTAIGVLDPTTPFNNVSWDNLTYALPEPSGAVTLIGSIAALLRRRRWRACALDTARPG